MISSQARREFQIRYYLWAISEFEREIEQSFENFRSSNLVSACDVLNFMGTLGKGEQLALAHALLNRFHPHAVRTLNENCTPEEVRLRDRFDAFRGECHSQTIQISRHRLSGEKLKHPGKRKLLSLTSHAFRNAFPNCVETNRDMVCDPSVNFEMKMGEWIICTNFWFGRREPLIEYSHGIATERIFEQKGVAGNIYQGTFPLAYMMSLYSWLGLRSQTQWVHLSADDVPVTINTVIKLCRRFFEVAPKLLKGLEIDSIG